MNLASTVEPGADGQGSEAPAGRGIRFRTRGLMSAAGTRINGMSYLPKWFILAAVIGVIAGLGAIVFYEALRLATEFFLGYITGYHVPTPAGEGLAPGTGFFPRAWTIPIVVTLGGLLAGFIVFTWAPEAEGHGTDAAIDAVHHNPRSIRVRAIVVKIVASAITIGTGGSGGREGPTAQISAGFGSLLARVLDLSPEDGRIAVSVGIGSGIGAIFSAPLGGAVLAADIVYRDDFEMGALLPGMFASIIAYVIFGGVFGYKPLFAIAGGYHFHAVQLGWFAIIGLLAGGIGLLYSKAFYGVVDLTAKLPFSRKLRPALGGLIVGFIALGLPEVLGTGYGWVQKGLGNDLLHVPLYIIIALPFARIVATALSIGTGGSGGVFGPGMVIGSFTGLAVWRILEPLAPASVGHNPAPYVIVAMMAVFGGISRAPLAVMLMVAQMTGSISLLAPAMVAVAIAWFIVSRVDDSIYRSQLRDRAASPAARLQFGMPLLATRAVSAVARTPRVTIPAATPVAGALEALQRASVDGAPVVDEEGTFLGSVTEARLARLIGEGREVTAGAAADTTAVTVAASASLDVGLEALMQAKGAWVTVTEGDRRVAGILSASDVVAGYRWALDEDTRRLSRISSHSTALDVKVGRNSALVGRQIRDAQLPRGCVIVTVHHGESLLFGTGETVLTAGDVLSVLTRPDNAEAVRLLISGEEPTDGEDGERSRNAESVRP